MALKPPLSDLPIKTSEVGFYRGFSVNVTVISKVIISMLVVWCIFWPTQAGGVLSSWNSAILANFAAWYIWVVAAFVIVCLGLAIWPAAGRLNLGSDSDTPEFSNFSWFSMMFGAGIGVGMLTFAVAEPVAHFGSNPETIQGLTTGGGRQCAHGLQMVVPALGSWRMGVLRDCGPVAGVL
jgi:choline-glycine betaine transporter